MVAGHRLPDTKWDLTVAANSEMLMAVKAGYEAKVVGYRHPLRSEDEVDVKESWELPSFHSQVGYIDGLYNEVNDTLYLD